MSDASVPFQRRYVVLAEARSGKNQMRIMRRRNGQTFIGKSKAAHGFIETAKTQLMVQQGRSQPYALPCTVTLLIYRRTRQRIDVDNLVSAVFDAMKDIVIDDDSLVMRLVAEKRYDAARPRVEITVEPYTPAQEALAA